MLRIQRAPPFHPHLLLRSLASPRQPSPGAIAHARQREAVVLRRLSSSFLFISLQLAPGTSALSFAPEGWFDPTFPLVSVRRALQSLVTVKATVPCYRLGESGESTRRTARQKMRMCPIRNDEFSSFDWSNCRLRLSVTTLFALSATSALACLQVSWAFSEFPLYLPSVPLLRPLTGPLFGSLLLRNGRGLSILSAAPSAGRSHSTRACQCRLCFSTSAADASPVRSPEHPTSYTALTCSATRSTPGPCSLTLTRPGLFT